MTMKIEDKKDFAHDCILPAVVVSWERMKNRMKAAGAGWIARIRTGEKGNR